MPDPQLSPAPDIRAVPAEAVDPDGFVNEFATLLAEGWSPDVEEFMGRVPEEHRDEVFRRIDELRANPPEIAEEDHLEPRAELEAEARAHPFGDHADRHLAEQEITEDARPVPTRAQWLLLRFIPRSIRDTFGAEWLVALRERSEDGIGSFEVKLLAAQEILLGVAQHAPLREPDPKADVAGGDPFSHRGWLAWRVCGLLLCLGALVQPLLLIAGGGLLALALTAAARRSQAPDETSRRLVNAVLGGTIVVLGATVLFGALTALGVIASIAFAVPALAGYAVTGLVSATTICLALVTSSGWSPDPWWPRRLVRLGR